MATISITWSWGAHDTVDFDPATDILDFGWMSADNVTISEVDGSVVISIAGNNHSYTLQGVTLADLSIANITGNDPSIFTEWSAALPAVHTVTGGTTVDIAIARGTDTILAFDPQHDVLDFAGLSASDIGIAEANGSVVIFLPKYQQTYILEGVSLADLSLSNIKGGDSALLAEWSAALNAADDHAVASIAARSSVAAADAGTTYSVGWQWDTQQVIHFDPAQDKLDFGWLLPQDFSLAEVNGSLVIILAVNQQTITLEGVTLADLSPDDIVAKTSLLTDSWAEAIAEAKGETPGDAGSGTDTTLQVIEAPDWSADTVYTAGDQVTVGHVVYEAKWWTLASNPETDNGAVGSGHVWTRIGYSDLIPVVAEAPDDFHAATTTDSSVTLTWDAADVLGVGTVSGYAIYEDGTLVGTTSERSFKVSGLSADTTYSFSIVALDEAGASQASTPLSVTTDAAGSHATDGQVFSPYVDLSVVSGSDDLLQQVTDAGITSLTLAFVVGTGDNQIGWAGLGADGTLADGSSIASVVDQLQANGVDLTISFGGGHAEEPALYFTDATALAAAYQSVIDTYGVTSLDFDIEGDALTNTAANTLRNEALAALEAANPDLSVSFTLPVLPTGLTQDDLDLLAAAHAAGVEIDTVNIMVMNYGEAHDSGDMGQDAIDAAEATIAQLQTLGIDAKVGITPMVGINDVQSEVFTLQDAQQLVDFADGNDHIASLAMWSLGRDHGDAPGHMTYDNSGVAQHDWDFAKIFATV
ncbi:fibronectin type III domain-containing protein [Xanthobacter sp.]|uniref:fibronectin type III domain-containing protein n=1 Tax=Xanthobacter sp. TaxID=35809 RepID=UPI0025E2CFF9|nr:fibronectin type III domain-containing protein [Xanthobacter sp.]